MLSAAQPPFFFRPGVTGTKESGSDRRRLRWLNAGLERAWRHGIASEPSLDPSALIARAIRQTRLDDFGENDFWWRNLDVLTSALEAEAALSPLGRTMAHGQLVSALANRLRAHELWRRHPGILERPLPNPIFIIGQMRSGTTRMQRLLACDQRFAHNRFFECWNPLPRTAGQIDDRRLRGALAIGLARLINPEFDAIHPVSLTEPDEEVGLQSPAVFGSAFEVQWRVPSFARHCEELDTTPVYAEFHKFLQTLAWLRGDPSDKPMIVKLPQMTQDLVTVLKIFPDARLILLDRDPAALAASAASLARNQMMVQSSEVDPHWIGKEWSRKVELRRARMEAALPAFSQTRIAIAWNEMEADWREPITRIYSCLGLPISECLIETMAARAAAGRTRSSRHRYAPEHFGLSGQAIATPLIV